MTQTNTQTPSKLAAKAFRQTLIISGMVLLSACGSGENSEQVNSSANEPASANKQPIKTVNLNLSDHPLDKAAFLGLVAPPVQESAPCPFLSDQTATSIPKSDWSLKRRETSNESCYWSKNLGFSIKLTIEPLATAQPVDSRSYNLDSKPVIKQQAGPGSKAFILYDTTWDNERPYAMSFEKEDKQIMIYVTGMPTDEARLTAAATEIAENLSNTITAPLKNESAGFDMCSTWSQSEIEAIIGANLKQTSGQLDCIWETGSGENMKQIRLTIYSGSSYPWEILLERGERNIEGIGERALMEKKRKGSNMPGHVLMNALYQEHLVTVSVTDTINDHQAVAVALAKNIDQRFE